VRTILDLKRGLIAVAVLLVAVPAAAAPPRASTAMTEVIVTLKAPPLADAHVRVLAGLTGHTLNAASAASRAYVNRLESAQARVEARIESGIPGASIRWRYHTVLNGFAVVLPRTLISALAHTIGVDRVWQGGVYKPQLDRTPSLIGATKLWGPTLATAGQGEKIAIIDEGIDQAHPFFSPSGFAYPPGFPKGNTAYTTPKVIVARVFPAPGANTPLETLPFFGSDGADDHGTIVAGIAGGDANTNAKGVHVSGIAPRAYLGNYKAMAAPTPGVGLDGNAPELAAAIEAAVNDGMNVINMSLGEVEVDPARDPVVKALDAAADAGVVSVVAAGNDFEDFGSGSITSPANAPKTIAVAAATGGHSTPTPDRIAAWSSGGPTPYSLEFKPDVTAPGVGVLSSVPPSEGLWDTAEGTSLAAPMVAGGAALLQQRHPTWTVAQIKSALVTTGVPVHFSNGHEVPATREGGGRIDLVRADAPFAFAQPSSLSFGLVRPGETVERTFALTQASSATSCSVRIRLQQAARGVKLGVPAQTTIPGTIHIHLAVSRNAVVGVRTGFVVLARQEGNLRVPFWLHVERPRLALDGAHTLTRAGVYRASTVGASSHVAEYRWPDLMPNTFPFPVRLRGPEVVYRFRLRHTVANFGVALLARAPGVKVTPRIVRDGDENKLAGYTGLPVDLNPYRSTFQDARLVAGVVLPGPDTYDIVFDSPKGSRRGPFTFRFWINDTTPPSLRVLSARNGTLRLAVRDGGAGVDPTTLQATIDGHRHGVSYSDGIARVSLDGVGRGSHTLVFRAADYQETKNMEDVGPILPNTGTLKTTIVVG
jgi:Subtilase family